MVVSITTASILSLIAGKVFDALAGKTIEKVTDAVIMKLRGDKAKKAFELALGEALKRYATNGNRFFIAEPLLRKDGPLTEQSVANELAQVLRFDREPNYQLIGDRWKKALTEPPTWIDFNQEAKIFVNHLRNELKISEVFGPVMEQKTLQDINDKASVSTDALYNIVDSLNELRSMMDAPMSDLMRAIAGASFSIQEQVRDFTWYVEDKTVDFVGRQFVFDHFNDFIQNNPRGYFIVRGDPGIGKTALAAQWVKTHKSAHHFNIRSISINRTEAFLRNICAQLIAAYELDHHFLPPEATQDGGFLMQLLNQVSDKLRFGEKAVIVVDALDEVEDLGASQGANILNLPSTLPKGIYFFVTSRRTDLRLRIECEQEKFDIEQDQKENIEDVKLYITLNAKLPGIHEYIADQKIADDLFIENMVTKSQGNFMYLFYVLRDINRGKYSDISVDQLPIGLKDYYEDHWRRMRKQSENDWLEYKLPVVVALSIVKEPVSIDLISDFSKVKELRRIRSVLLEWQQFLYETKVDYEGGLQDRWRVYHDSFREFIASKDEIEGEYVNLKKAHGNIADTLWVELFGEENKS